MRRPTLHSRRRPRRPRDEPRAYRRGFDHVVFEAAAVAERWRSRSVGVAASPDAELANTPPRAAV